MSTNAFMPMPLPQTPAPDSNFVPGKSSAAFKSNRPGEGVDQGKSFSATLDRISDRNRRCNPDSNRAEKPAVRSRGKDTEPVKPQKMCKRKASANENNEENRAPESPESKNASRPIHPWLAFGLLPSQLAIGSEVGDGSLAMETSPDSTSGLKRMLINWIAHLQSHGQKAQGDLVGIGPFEQLQANISPETLNRFFFDRFAAGIIHHQDSVDLLGKAFQDGASIGQPEPSGTNVNALLHMLKIYGTAMGLNPDAGNSGEPKMPAGLEGAHLNKDFLIKMTSPAQTVEIHRFEDAKMALAGPEGRVAPWASGNSNSDTLLDAQGRQLNGDSQALKNQAALKAATQQPANPNAATGAATTKTPEEILGIKNPVYRNGIEPIQSLGNKIGQVDADNKDSGFLFSQDQMPQHLSRLENAGQRSEATQRSLMSQTLNQIVQKAVHSLNNGQHEVRIELKPDFLGPIRMQILTESQQVAVRIVAEVPLVKEILENNLNQLKAELQAQGLKVDELEVSVAHDSGADGDKHQKAAEVLRARALKNSRLSVAAATEEPTDVHAARGDGISETAIDYFA